MRSWSNMIEDLIFRVTDIGSTMIEKNIQTSLTQQCHQLLENTGEATSLALSREILDRFQHLQDAEKVEFFQSLYSEFGPDVVAMKKAIADWHQDPQNHRARSIHFASEPKTQELVRQLNRAPNGTASLVSLREDLLSLGKKDPNLRSLDKDLQHLFSSWFNRGFLRIEQISWSTSAKILEKIIEYEAVHEIQGWDDLRQRVAENDRRLYAFFHPALPNEPLIFVEVALTQEIPSTIESILSTDRQALAASEATTAVFYSISNCQSGLRGISFGNFLIKQVVEELKKELPNLTTFITMSPVPGFRKWLTQQKDLNDDTATLLRTLDASIEQSDTLPSTQQRESLEEALLLLATRYLLTAKSAKGAPFDPVSRFHLGNGAHLERINLWADSSRKGINSAYGIMVNYEYDLRHIEKNHEAFTNQGSIKTSASVRKLSKKL